MGSGPPVDWCVCVGGRAACEQLRVCMLCLALPFGHSDGISEWPSFLLKLFIGVVSDESRPGDGETCCGTARFCHVS